MLTEFKHIKMKNKIFKILTAFLLLLTISSCEKLLEEEPQNKLKPRTLDDFTELLNYGYPSPKDYGTQVPLDYYVEMMTDDADIRYYNADRNAYPIIPFSFSNTHEDRTMMGGYDMAWKNFYEAIYYANVVISNIDNIEADEVELNYLKGEALALRAFSFFRLINLYAKPYDEATAPSDPGVPLKLDPVVQSESYTRNTVQEIYDQIDQDLDEAIVLMEENDQRVMSKYKLRPISAHLLASRVALYKEDYPGTIEEATMVIEANPLMFDLSGNDFTEAQGWGYGGKTHYFNQENTNVLFVYGTNVFYTHFYYPGGLGLSDDLQSIFEPGDIRLYYFSYPKSGIGRVYYKYRPYPNRTAEAIRGFRVEEAYLNRAEAYAMSDDGISQAAIDDINHIRRYKFDAGYGSEGYYELTASEFADKDELIEAVRTERRRELCFEFHRWYDLRRYGMPEIVHQYGTETYVLPAGDPRYVLQIPQRELDYNPEMKRNPR
jgi:hypothetical protein